MYIEKSSVPVMAVTLSITDPQTRAALNASLDKLIQTDNQLATYPARYKENEVILGGAGELHLQKTLTQLRALCPAIQVSAPYVLYRETVFEKSDSNIVALSKSPNKANLFYGYAEPLSKALMDAIDQGAILNLSESECAAYLHNQHGWNLQEAQKIWSWGPTQNATNCLIDGTKGIAPIPDQVKQDCISAFKEVCQAGVLAEELLRGVKFVITNAILASTDRQRSFSQINPTFQRFIRGLQLISVPRLLEAYYLLQLTIPTDSVPKVRALLAAKRTIDLNDLEHKKAAYIPEHLSKDQVFLSVCQIVNTNADDSTNTLLFHLPVAESFGLAEALETLTANTAHAELTFSHWMAIQGDVFDPSLSASYIQAIRKRKNLRENIPPTDAYIDKL